jgi:KDO2-lipid IV(A) lauroyltransferase
MSFGLKCFAWCAKGLGLLVLALPRSWRFAVGDILGLLWFDVFRIRRDVVLANLQKAFPDWGPAQRTKIGRSSLCNLGRDLMEYFELPYMTPAKVEERFVIEGREHLDRALDEGKGVCLLTLHLGNGDFAIGALSCLGIPMYLISKEFKLKWLNELWFGMRSRLGTKFIPPRNSSYSVLKALKKNGVVVFVLDQFTGPPIGVKTRFFGHETGTGLGLAMMAERAGSPVIPVYTLRRPDQKHLIHFDPAVPFETFGSRDEALAHMTQRYNDVLETYVKKCPQQWMWIHKRWKIFRVG